MRAQVSVVMAIVAIGLAGCTGGEIVSWTASSSQAILTPHPFPDLLIEVSVIGTQGPDEAALASFMQTVRDTVEKREVTVSIARHDDIAARSTWRPSDVTAVHNAVFDGGDPADIGSGEAGYLHILYLAGRDHEDVGGRSFGRFVAIFPETIREQLQWGALTREEVSRIEAFVLIHEFGHSAGLINNGIPMLTPRLAEDGVHSTEKESVMFSHPNTLAVASDGEVLQVPSFSLNFTAADLRDIQSFQATIAASAGAEAG